MRKETMNSKETKDGYMGGFEERIERGKWWHYSFKKKLIFRK